MNLNKEMTIAIPIIAERVSKIHDFNQDEYAMNTYNNIDSSIPFCIYYTPLVE